MKGEGNQQDYGMRGYDNRLGRFLSVDPLTGQYPELTPFQFASNSPIKAIDLDGCEMKDALDFGWGPENSRREEIRSRLANVDGKQWLVAPAAVVTTGASASLIQVPGAVVSTVNWGLRIFGSSQILGSFYHNKSNSEEQSKERASEALNNISNAICAEVGGRILNIAFSSARKLFNFGSKALGEMGEEALSRQYRTIKPSGKGSSLSTSLGTRKPDGIPIGTNIYSTNILFESKVGYQTYSGNIINQVQKDEELLLSGKVEEIKWIFFRSPSTGMVGADNELLLQLKNAGIKTEIAGEIPNDIVKKYIIKYGAKPR